jgi:hypothetical protein
VDIILEMLANVNLSNDTKLLASNGRVIVISSRGEVTINPRELMARRASIRAFTLWGITAAEEADIHAGLLTLRRPKSSGAVRTRVPPTARCVSCSAAAWGDRWRAGECRVPSGELPGRPMQQPLAALQKRDRGRKLQLRVRCSNNLRSLSSVRCPSLPRPPRKRAISRST